MTSVSVPCNGCTACCRGEAIELHPEMGDDVASYDTMVVEIGAPGIPSRKATVLRLNPDGSCVYLGEGGCTIHDRAPQICRVFDCRRFAMSLGNRAQRRKAAAMSDVVAAGLERARTL